MARADPGVRAGLTVTQRPVLAGVELSREQAENGWQTADTPSTRIGIPWIGIYL